MDGLIKMTKMPCKTCLKLFSCKNQLISFKYYLRKEDTITKYYDMKDIIKECKDALDYVNDSTDFRLRYERVRDIYEYIYNYPQEVEKNE